MIRGLHVGRTPAVRKTFGDIIERYIVEVPRYRPWEERASPRRRISVACCAKAICAYAVSNRT
jgi:hypothetical protein